MEAKRPKYLIFFYILVVYIIASYCWWAFLLNQKNDEIFRERAEKLNIEYNLANEMSPDSRAFFKTPTYVELKEKHDSQRWMIVGEGLVFLVLILIGAVALWRTTYREIRLARQQNNFLLSITHELKTPLASVRLGLQTLKARVTMQPKFNALMDNSLEDVDRLEMLVNNILLAAKVEDSRYTFEKEEVDISTLTKNLVEKARIAYDIDRNCIQCHIEDGITGHVDVVPFSSAVMNLIENAHKYSPKGEYIIEVKLFRANGLINLEVADNGIGISEADKGRIFEKFYRVGNEETRSTKGTGLGLFIVKRVSENHGGKVVVVDNQPSGSRFRLTIPA